MLCPRCHGTRYAVANGHRVPCPECGGFGEVHCCDGPEDPDVASACPTRPTPAATPARPDAGSIPTG